MPYLLNLIYLTALAVLSPWLVFKAFTTGKYRRGMAAKAFGLAPKRHGTRPCAWFHGVSVGEIHLLRQVVATFRRQHPDWECVVSTTTDTGFEEARKHFGELAVFWWPFDFSWAVCRAIQRINPRLVVLAEGEMWPNFLRAAKRHGATVAVVNARMSPRSLRHYQALGWLSRSLLSHVDLVIAQTEQYAMNFRSLGVPFERVRTTGNVKYDGVNTDRNNAKTQDLRHLLGVKPGDLNWVCGSTQAPEESVALAIFDRLRPEFPGLRLFLVPRQRERFDEVAGLLRRRGKPFCRRSLLEPDGKAGERVVLVDTIGELGAIWGLAHVAFVGGSLDGKRGGQNMIEPAAWGAAVVFGPHVWNFRDASSRLTGAGAAVQVQDAAELEETIRRLVRDANERQRLGLAARSFVAGQQGATERTVALLAQLTSPRVARAA